MKIWWLILKNFFDFSGCYGINDEDSDSGKSNDTDSPTELWFCDACKVGLQPVGLFLCMCYYKAQRGAPPRGQNLF